MPAPARVHGACNMLRNSLHTQTHLQHGAQVQTQEEPAWLGSTCFDERSTLHECYPFARGLVMQCVTKEALR